MWTHGGHWERNGKIVRRETKAMWTQIYFYFLSFSYNAQPKVIVYYNCGAKKYNFSSIAGYSLIFSGAKIAI